MFRLRNELKKWRGDTFVTSWEDVLVRVWFPKYEDWGVLDLMYQVGEGAFMGVQEALVKKKRGVWVAQPRNRGKDMRKDWMPVVTQEILAPVSAGTMTPHREHIYAKCKVEEFIDEGDIDYRLTDFQIITPDEYERIQGL
jgi:hypothetical protein